jgi:DNA-binding NarL/FixJ family response regulator
VEAGACGYISKSEPASELARAIVTLHQGGTFFSAGFRDLLESRPSEAGAPQLRMARRLSTREREVLVLLADGMTNKQTAAILDLSVRTIEKHRERIMEKLKLHNMVELTKYAIANELVAVP